MKYLHLTTIILISFLLIALLSERDSQVLTELHIQSSRKAIVSKFKSCNIGYTDTGNKLALAIISVEHAAVRFETQLFDSFLYQLYRSGMYFGNYSLGIARIKPNTARNLTIRSLTEQEIAVKLITDDCFSIQLSVEYVNQLIKNCRERFSEDTCKYFAISKYNGQKTNNLQNTIYIKYVIKINNISSDAF